VDDAPGLDRDLSRRPVLHQRIEVVPFFVAVNVSIRVCVSGLDGTSMT